MPLQRLKLGMRTHLLNLNWIIHKIKLTSIRFKESFHTEGPGDSSFRNKTCISRLVGNKTQSMFEDLQKPREKCLSMVNVPYEHPGCRCIFHDFIALLSCWPTYEGKASIQAGSVEWYAPTAPSIWVSTLPAWQSSKKSVLVLLSWHSFREHVVEQANILLTEPFLLCFLQQKW